MLLEYILFPNLSLVLCLRHIHTSNTFVGFSLAYSGRETGSSKITSVILK